MMSSEEDTECFGLYDKLLVNIINSRKKNIADKTSLSNSNSNSSTSSNISYSCSSNIKRNRLRVDAGEPRNTYTSIPNFSSRSSSFMSSASTGIGSLYGALLNSTQTAHFVGGLFGPNGFGSTKMLNEIFGRQMKKAQDATSGLPTSFTDNSIVAALETTTNADLMESNMSSNLRSSKILSNNCISNSSIQTAENAANNNSNSDTASSNSSPALTTEDQKVNNSEAIELDSTKSFNQQTLYSAQQQHHDLAHQMLRNILQGKKDLIVLDQELRSVINQHNNNLNLNSNSDSNVKSDNCEHHSSRENAEINKNKNCSINMSNNNSESHSKKLGSNVEIETSNIIDCNCESNIHSTICKNSANVGENMESSGCPLTNVLGQCGEVNVKSEVDVTTTINITNVPSGVYTGSNKSEYSSSFSRNNIRKNRSTDDSSRNIINENEESLTKECIRKKNDLASSNIYQLHNNNRSDRQQLQEIEGVVAKRETDDLLGDEPIALNSKSDMESLGSPGISDINDMTKDGQTDDHEKSIIVMENRPIKSAQPVVLDIKRARVEHIVSSMRSSPSLHQQSHLQVNGCKKRKLYQPQQHAMEEYAAAAASLNFGFNFHSLMLEEDEEEDVESPQIQQKRVEKNALKSQLRSMQEQLAEMQQKYVQLCTRMEQESENQEIDETASDSADQDDNLGNTSPSSSLPDAANLKTLERTASSSPSLYSTKANKKVGVSVEVNRSPQILTQVMSKMITAKSHNQSNLNSPQIIQQLPQVAGEGRHSNTSPTITGATAMYLSQQFLLEQEARLARETAQLHHQQQKENQQRHEQKHHEQQQKQKVQQQLQRQHSINQLQKNQRQEQHEQNHQQQLEMHQISVHSNSSSGNHSSMLQSQRSQQQQQSHISTSIHSSIKSEISEKFNMLRSHSSSIVRMSGSDLEGLADVLKSEITTSLSALVDTIVTRFVNQRKQFNKQSHSVAAAAEQLNKDLLLASQILERKSPRSKTMEHLSSNLVNATSKTTTKTIQHPSCIQSGNGLVYNSTNNQTTSTNCSISNDSSNNHNNPSSLLLANRLTNTSSNVISSGPRINGNSMAYTAPSNIGMQLHHSTGINCSQNQPDSNCNSSINVPSPHIRHSSSATIFQAPKTPQSINPVAAAALYNSMNVIGGGANTSHTNQINPFCVSEAKDQNAEQNEALSLVVTPKKKRHKVTDTRITPRTVSRILAQDTLIGSSQNNSNTTLESSNCQSSSIQNNKFVSQPPNNTNNISMAPTIATPSQSPSPRSTQYHQPPPPPQMLPVSLPTSVAIPNPSLHESQVFSPYSPFFNPHHGPHGPHSGSHAPPIAGQMHHIKMSSSPPGLGSVIDSSDSPPLPHPPNMLHPALLAAAHHGNSPDYGAHLRAAMDAQDRSSDCNSAEIQFDGMQPTISFLKQQMIKTDSLTPLHSSTLTPMHLRKAKLMFFWVRYPSSAVLKMYFPDIKFNKNNTAQLVKWFSNFREFYYIQMEKYARQAVTEGIKNGDDIHVGGDSELYRVLNLHYNRNNHIEVPSNFRYVVEQTLREFFRAIQSGKDTEQSWKKSIYKIISRLDDPVPEYFKSPNFLEQLE